MLVIGFSQRVNTCLSFEVNWGLFISLFFFLVLLSVFFSFIFSEKNSGISYSFSDLSGVFVHY